MFRSCKQFVSAFSVSTPGQASNRHVPAALDPHLNHKQTPMEAVMKFANSLLARFGLFAQKSEGPDAFDLRLQRIGTRERRLQVRLHLFKGQLQPMEA